MMIGKQKAIGFGLGCLFLMWHAPEGAAAPGPKGSDDPKIASATVPVSAKPVTVYSGIATKEIRSGHTLTPPGFPTGKPAFVVNPGQKVDLLNIFPNDSESVYTCQVRNSKGQIGYIECGLDWEEWTGDKGALVRLSLEEPYEYEGDIAGPLAGIDKLKKFTEEHPTSRYASYARLAVLSSRCSLLSSLVQGVWADLDGLKRNGSLSDGEVKIPVKWTPKANQMYSALEKSEMKRLQETLALCSLVAELQRTVPSPVRDVNEP